DRGANADPITWQVCPPARTDIREGSLATIRCEANLESEAKDANNIYKWEYRSRAGQYSFKRLSPHPKLHYSPYGSRGDLHIRSVDRDDDGKQFMCLRGPKDANKLTRCPKETTLRVFWLNPNVTVARIEPPTNLQLKSNDRVVLECQLQASEPPTSVRWFLNGKILCRQNEQRNNSECIPMGSDFQQPSLSQLVITKLTKLLSGVYHCYVEATGGKVLTRSPLPVFFDGIGSKFGNPVHYVRNDEKVRLPTFDLDESDHKLWFTLKAFGYQHIDRKKIDMVMDSSDRSISTSGLELRNNRWRSDTTKLRISEAFAGTSHFYLVRLVLLKSQFTAEFLYEVVQTKNSGLDGNKNFEPPVTFRPLLVPINSVFVQRVYLPYRDQSSGQEWIPMPSVTWTAPGGARVPRESESPSARVRIVRDYHLQLDSARKSDSGTYTIRLENPAGSSEMPLSLLVTYPPTLSKVPVSKVATEDDKGLTIACPYSPGNVVTQLTKFDWYKYTQGSSLPVLVASSSSAPDSGADSAVVASSAIGMPTAAKSYRVSPDGALTFQSVSLHHAGVYACLAVTRLDDLGTPVSEKSDSSGNITLSVKRKFQLCPAKNSAVQETLDCPWSGEYAPRISWSRRSGPGDAFQSIPVDTLSGGGGSGGIELSPDGTRLTFHYVSKEMRGQYRIVAEGPQGRLEKIFNVEVGAKPVFRRISPNTTVELGDTVRLDCEVTGDPRPTITWTFRPFGSGGGVGDYRPTAITQDMFKRDNSSRLLTADSLRREDLEKTRNLFLFPNGTLIIHRATMGHAGEYQCLAATVYILMPNKHTVHLRVLDPNAGEASGSSDKNSMMKTVIIVPEYKTLLSQSGRYSPPRADLIYDGNSVSGISSSLQSTYGRLRTNTPANSIIETTLDRLCRTHQTDRKLIQYRPGILGRGLFGTVRIGTLNGATVLIKELTTDDPQLTAQFVEQMKLFNKCDHDYVTRFVGICIDSNPMEAPLMLLEYCEYNNLFEVLTGLKKHGEHLSKDHLVRMCLQVAQALEHMHCLGFVHGDIGCRNVLVAQEYNLKLTNLGPCLDRFTGQYARSSQGTLLPIRWLPPEATAYGQFGIKTDVWSFGVLVCEVFGMGRR
uniref:Ig-like domain-containing protein n=1 Tax=Macrostomum lignano TaxID=282301 RepID=A0A1I8I186_9PLAT